MSARKPKAPFFTAAERAILDPLATRCIKACVEASRFAAEWPGVACKGDCAAFAEQFKAAKEETIAAGKAFDAALAKLRGGK